MSGVAAAALLAAGMRLAASHGYPDGAPAGFSGGFKEDSCLACHFDQDLNAPPGRVSIEGVPVQYEAGRRYTLTITLNRDGMQRAGFQLTARFKDGGTQAGTLEPAETARVAVTDDGKVQYAGQKKEGSTLTEAGVARWSVVWRAPSAGGPVVFNVAANAADGNGSAGGDFIYASMSESVVSGTPRQRRRR